MDKKHKCPARPPERAELSNNPVKMCNEISHIFHAKMRELNESEDTAAQPGTRLVLSFLAAGDGVTQLDLVNATHLRPPTISIILKKLEEDGIVERRRDEQDLRSVRVYLTERGKDIDSRNIRKIKFVDSIALEGLSEDEKNTMMSLLGKMRDNLLRSKNTKANYTESEEILKK